MIACSARPASKRTLGWRTALVLLTLDAEIAPLAQAGTELTNPRWGLLTRAGNDKSHLTRQIERYADIYTSRVSNFLHATPYAYFRSPRGRLPHYPGGALVG